MNVVLKYRRPIVLYSGGVRRNRTVLAPQQLGNEHVLRGCLACGRKIQVALMLVVRLAKTENIFESV